MDDLKICSCLEMAPRDISEIYDTLSQICTQCLGLWYSIVSVIPMKKNIFVLCTEKLKENKVKGLGKPRHFGSFNPTKFII